jgi:outer membrane protein OmpA-like peptidoglycan-associated protein
MHRMAFCAVWLAATTAFAQYPAAVDQLKAGREIYDKGKYLDAIPYFQRAIPQKPGDPAPFFWLASAYLNAEQYKNAVDTFRAYGNMDKNPVPAYWYRRASAHKELNELEQCAPLLEQYLTKQGHRNDLAALRSLVRHLHRYCTESPKLRASVPSSRDPVSMGSIVNSPASDYMPQANPTGRILYFTSNRPGGFAAGQQEDLYSIERTEAGWSRPVPLPRPINSEKNEGAPAFSSDGQTLVFVGCNRADGEGDCDLYTAQLDGATWSAPRNMGDVVNGKHWDSQPTMSFDGNMVIFTSGRPGGYGNEDLYMTTKDRFGEWSTPVNLGPTINTPFDDKSPYLASDGRTLYFASSGHPGFGKQDVFKSVYEDGKWSEPVNLGRPINSAGDDRYFTIGGSGEVGYFASDRPGGFGALDLFQVDIPEPLRPRPIVVVSGTVSDVKTKKPLGARVLVEDLQSGELVASARSNSDTGRYLVVLPSGRTYSVSTSRDGYFFSSNKFEVPSGSRFQELTRDIQLSPIEKGSRVVLNNVFFETGKATLSPDSRLELGKAIELLRQNPRMVVEVGGHTDNVGKPDANMKLSHDRARSVFDYLQKGGVPGDRLRAKGYGQLQPVASNETPEGRHQNRRTEFVIVEY